MGEHFRKFAAKIAHLAGSPGAFLLAAAVIAIWALSGPFLHFSDVWQLTINTGTTIVTFLMVFLIQNAQNRDSRAVHLKLDELLRASATAHNTMIDLEDLSDDALQQLQDTFQHLREDAAPPWPTMPTTWQARSIRPANAVSIQGRREGTGPADTIQRTINRGERCTSSSQPTA